MADDPWRLVGEDEEDGGNVEREPSRDNIIVLIDAREPMLEKNANGEVYLENALKAAEMTLRDKIISQENDMVGIVFMGAQNKKNENGWDGIHELHDMDVPSAQRIRDLKQMLEDGGETFRSKVGSRPGDEPLPVAHALWHCETAFARANAKPSDYQRIWVFTNDDDPCRGDNAAIKHAVKKAKDCTDQDKLMVLWHMSRPGKEFDMRRFWGNIVPEDEDGSHRHLETSLETLEDVIDRTRTKVHRKRVYASVPMELPGGHKLGVSLYNTLLPAKKPPATTLDARTNQPLRCETRWLCKSTASLLLDHQIKTYQEYGRDKVFVSKEEMTAVKQVTPEPVLRLLGFKSVSKLLNRHSVRAPYFLQPDERNMTGSTVAFRALLEKMLELRRMGVALLTPRANAQPRLVALLPQAEVEDEDGDVEQSGGLWALALPFADDIRRLEFGAQHKASDDQVAAMSTIVNAMDLPEFSPREFRNPVLQKHYATVEALALEEEEVEWNEEDDPVQPAPEAATEFKDEVEKLKARFGAAPPSAVSAAAAKAKGGGAASRKRERPGGSGAAGEGSGINWQQAADSGRLAKLTVPVLKEYLREHGLPLSGKKADLVARIEGHLAQ